MIKRPGFQSGGNKLSKPMKVIKIFNNAIRTDDHRVWNLNHVVPYRGKEICDAEDAEENDNSRLGKDNGSTDDFLRRSDRKTRRPLKDTVVLLKPDIKPPAYGGELIPLHRYFIGSTEYKDHHISGFQSGGNKLSKPMKVIKIFNNAIRTDDHRVWNLNHVVPYRGKEICDAEDAEENDNSRLGKDNGSTDDFLRRSDRKTRRPVYLKDYM
ncbi:hypothetical protein NDU88_005666 [Pleurodeles waltl]|uniref:Uncharacterized protein n=1 Tax=Pleurodeles waltl TaxID=8319 RepID=A0AAV7QFJ5_PLEWA|nr:hypothetical protein NDU88_005666 [Pleurodeles waltl]